MLLQKTSLLKLSELKRHGCPDTPLYAAVATQGKSAGSQFEMSKSEMQKADGGYYRGVGGYYYNSNTRSSYSSNAHTRIYARAWGSYYWGRRY